MSYLVKVILEEHGYDVRMLNADLAPIFASLSRKKADVFMDVWLPVTMHDYTETSWKSSAMYTTMHASAW